MSRILKTSAEGRKCKFPACTHNLSIYNHEDFCHQHRDMMAEQQKPKFIKTAAPAVEIMQINPAGDGFIKPLKYEVS